MDAITAITSRRVVRAFARKPVALAQLKTIIDAGRHAMSARNLQPWQFVVVLDPATLETLGRLCTTGRFVGQAPAAVVVLKDYDNRRWADIDCAQAVQNMANAARALGLGTCWVGNFAADKIAELLAVPPRWSVFTVLPLGYADPGAARESRQLRPRSQTAHYERFGRNVPWQ